MESLAGHLSPKCRVPAPICTHVTWPAREPTRNETFPLFQELLAGDPVCFAAAEAVCLNRAQAEQVSYFIVASEAVCHKNVLYCFGMIRF